MNILFLARLYSPHVGGVERHLAEISLELIKRKHKVSIITTKFENDLKEKEKKNGVNVIRFKQPKIKYIGLISTWLWFIKNRKLIGKFDIIHAHDVFIWYLPLKLLNPKKKIFVTFHGYETYPIKLRAKLLRKLAEKMSDGNLCIGKFIEKWYRTKADLVSFGAVDLKNFFPPKNRRFEYDAIFASRLDEHTGITTYIKVLDILKKKGIHFKLLVLGEGRYRKKAEKVADVRGWVDDPSLYFNKARFAFVNRYLAILEAFATKKLVFAVYDNPVKRDYLLMTPFRKWIVIENNPDKLAKKIVLYKKAPAKARKMIESAFEWVQAQTWDKMVDNYLMLWSAT